MSDKLLETLIKLRKINQILSSKQKEFNKSVESFLNFDLNDNPFVDGIKLCRSDLIITNSKKRYVCCGPKTNGKLKNDKNGNQFKCKNCKKVFKKKCQLKRHEAVHTKVRPFMCKTCNKRFKHKFVLKKHRLVHTNDRPFACDWNECRKKFKLNADLIKHKRSVHLKERTIKCNHKTCKKKFFNRRDLERHQRIHTGIKPFVCDHKNCDKKYAHKSNLITHQRTHLKAKKIKNQTKN